MSIELGCWSLKHAQAGAAFGVADDLPDRETTLHSATLAQPTQPTKIAPARSAPRSPGTQRTKIARHAAHQDRPARRA
jgi:hypothetical protein